VITAWSRNVEDAENCTSGGKLVQNGMSIAELKSSSEARVPTIGIGRPSYFLDSVNLLVSIG
jgi:hypothetical protein